jgi:hypothetical protein
MSSSASRRSGRQPQAFLTRRLSSPRPSHRSDRPLPNSSGLSNILHESRHQNEIRRSNDHFAPSIDDALDHVIVALDMRDKDKVGCTYYLASEERLLCMEEVSGGGIEVVERCMFLASREGQSRTHHEQCRLTCNQPQSFCPHDLMLQ